MSDQPFRDPADGYRWLESFTNLETIQAARNRQLYRLDRMHYLLGRFGDPHLAVPSVHVAGSKGKGSTAALIASALSEMGRVGLYTSPHVSSYDERIAVGSSPAPADVVLRQMNAVRELVRSLPPGTLPVSPTPTTFELLTLIAFLVFREVGCDWIVLEVGIGGRLDATNVVVPRVSVISPIELEHVEILGSTLEEIAGEKAGIIKPGVPVLSAAQRPEVRRVLEAVAGEKAAPIVFADDAVRLVSVAVDRDGTRLAADVEGAHVELELAMPGVFQADNALLALLALRRIPGCPDLETIRRAFARTVLPGRMERLATADGRPVVLDGAHTPQSVRRAADSFLRMYPDGGVLLFGSILGKRTQEMADALAPLFDAVVVSRPNSFKESNPGEVRDAFLRAHARCVLVEDPARALEAAGAAAGSGRPVFVTGSFYMISEVRKLLLSLPDSRLTALANDRGALPDSRLTALANDRGALPDSRLTALANDRGALPDSRLTALANDRGDQRILLDGRLRVVTGDITRLEVDAVVNAANGTLLGGGGVDGAIHRAGGPDILAQCREIRRTRYPDGLPTGKAVATTAGRLPARAVIHTVGPVWRDGKSGEAALLASAYRESLDVASEIGARTVAFPAISTGVYGYPKAEAARVAWGVLRDHLARETLPQTVTLVFYSPTDARVFLDTVDADTGRPS